MYDHIAGEVTSVHPARVVVRAAGVGYDLHVPMSVSSALATGHQACLFTILHVTDGNPTLLGFANLAERDFARMLMSVSGVGPAMTLAILSSHDVPRIAHALFEGEHALLQGVKGVGKKTAERLCLELRDKVGALALGVGSIPGEGPATLPESSEDAVGALMTLGYAEKDARLKVHKHLEQSPDASTEDLVRSVLRG